MKDLPWDGLSDSAKAAVSDLICLLAGRFTGRVEIECMEGGVRNFREIRERRSAQLGQLTGSGKTPSEGKS
jgi:hypothetical protein